MIGTMFGPYRVEALLGRGGMGEVYRAVDSAQGRDVALKVLPESMSDDRDFVARFRRESEIAARVADPHVVPIHRYGEIDGRLFLDMQLVDGRELGAVLAADGPLAPARAVALIAQVAAALDAAHADGLVHRDVKPSNILVTDPGKGRPEFAYLVDFGIARPTDLGSRTALTRTGAVVGTLAYMAPERFLARPAGPPADVYALACVLHELLTGERPFPGTGYAPQVHGHIELPPPRPGTRRPGVPAAFDAVIAVGMAKEPTARHRTAGELAAHAHSALTERRVPTLPAAVDPAWRPAPEPPRRRGRLVAAAVAAVAAVVVLATVLVVNRPGADPATDPASAAAPAPDAAAAPVDPSGLPERTLLMRDPFGALVAADVGGRALVVALDQTGGPVVTLDLEADDPVAPAIDDGGGLASVATAEIDGRAVTVTGGFDGIVRLWDTATGEALPLTITGPAGSADELVVTELDGRPVLVTSGNSTDNRTRRYDLTTGAPIGEAITADDRTMSGLRVETVDGQPVIIAQVEGLDIREADYRMWDLRTGSPVGSGPVSVDPVGQLTTGVIDGRPVVVAWQNLEVTDPVEYTVRDLGTGEELARYPSDDYVTGLELLIVDGRPLIARGVSDNTIELVDARTFEPVGMPFAGHEGAVQDMAHVADDGRTYLVSTGFDETVRIWDVTARIGG